MVWGWVVVCMYRNIVWNRRLFRFGFVAVFTMFVGLAMAGTSDPPPIALLELSHNCDLYRGMQ